MKAKFRKDGFSVQVDREVLQKRNRVPIGDSDGVESPVVSACAVGTVPFWLHMDRRSPGAAERSADPLFYKLFKLSLSEFQFVGGETSRPLGDGGGGGGGPEWLCDEIPHGVLWVQPASVR